MKITAVVLVLVFASARANADDSDDERSPAAAFGLGLFPTALGATGLLVNAINGDPIASLWPSALVTVGPSLGHLYTHSFGLAAIGAGIRLGGALLLYEGSGHCEPGVVGDDFPCALTGYNSTEVRAGLAIIGVAAAVELIDAPLSASRYNDAHAHAAIVPMAAPGRVGLAIAGTF
ncbi:MAG: hypothetical protein JO257_29640 [Deltaproteobacteria bacterium]|nr:hypothetical protein [Deltaproteobacteria bacterium]